MGPLFRTSRMASYGYDACSPQCPTSTVTIQPPPFVVTIPGPELHCPDRAFYIQQYNPCAKIYGGSRYPALTSSEYTDSGSSYTLPSLSSRSYSSYGYRRY
ncbi:UNVERIFIED_CONTAM: hypothetical protein K2H54_024521 [Gekko kuhli]